MKNLRLHLTVLILIVVAEFIGNIVITVGIGKIVLLPMMYALIMGILTAPRFTKISTDKEIRVASSLLGVTLMLLMAKYGTLVGPSLPKILAASGAHPTGIRQFRHYSPRYSRGGFHRPQTGGYRRGAFRRAGTECGSHR